MAVEYIKLALHNNQTLEQIEQACNQVYSVCCVHVILMSSNMAVCTSSWQNKDMLQQIEQE
jgi:hypothetical protein